MAAASGTSSPKIPFHEWKMSNVTDGHLQKLFNDDVLPAKEIIGWRAAAGKKFPSPHTDEVVVFSSFFYRGFSLPTSSFFRGLLKFYNIRIYHLNPNSVLQIAIFIHLCEAFLGIEPHFNLFRSLFCIKP